MGAGSDGSPERHRAERLPSEGSDDDYDPDDYRGELDDRLRAEFATSFSQQSDPRQALTEVRPAMVRARRRRVGQQLVTASVAMVAATAAAVFALGQFSPGSGDELISVDAANDSTAPSPASESQRTDQTGLEVLPPTAADGGDPTATNSTPAANAASSVSITVEDSSETPDPTSESPIGTEAPTTTTPITAPPATTSTTPPSSTTQSTTTIGTASVPPGSSSETIDSQCGSIVVSFDGSTLELIEVRPSGSHTADIKSTGPTKIEVSFEGGGPHCELEAKIRNGRLVTESEEE